MRWFVHDGTSQGGPYDERQIVERIVSGAVTQGLIAREGTTEWLPIESHSPFARALQEARSRREAAPAAPPPAANPLMMAAVVGIALALGAGGVLVWKLGFAEPEGLDARVVTAKASPRDPELLDVTLGVTEGFHQLSVSAEKGAVAVELGPAGCALARSDELTCSFRVPDEHFPGGESTPLDLTLVGTTKSGQQYRKALTVAVDKERRLMLHANAEEAGFTCGSRCSGKLEKTGSLRLELPQGATASVDGTTARNGDRLTLDLGRHLAEARFEKQVGMKLPVKVDVDGETLEGTLALPGSFVEAYAFTRLAAAGTGRKVKLAGNDKADGKPRAVLFDGKVIGSWRSYDEIDLVAERTEVTKDAGDCGSFKNTKTGEIVTVHKQRRNHRYAVYDRRTGELVKKREVTAASPRCPERVDPRKGPIVSEADPAKGIAFLRSLIR